MSNRHHHHDSASVRSQEKKYRHIAWMRKAKRWLKKGLIIVAIILALAVVLSYVFITKEKEPDNLEIPEKGFHGIF